MRKLIENRFGLLALVVVALVAIYGVALASRPPQVPAKIADPRRVTVQAVSAVCPDPGGATLSVVTPPAAQRASGLAKVTEIGTDKPLTTRDVPGDLWQKELDDKSKAVRIDAAGDMAAGLEAAQTSRATSGAGRGLAGTRCVEPGAAAWFVGPGPASADTTLYLDNIDEAPANVSIMLYAGEGPVLSDRGNGMVLRPGEHREVDLKTLAPSPLVMAVSITTATGRVTAAIKEEVTGGGVDWLPLAAEPAKTVVVPGIPAVAGRRELYVAVPGEEDTVVSVKAVLKDGSYALKNRESLDVPAGSTTTFDLSTGLTGQPASLVLTADRPIVAGLKITGTGAKPDVAFTAGAPPIDIGSVVADNRNSDKDHVTRLVLSAPFKAAKVRLQLLPRDGTPLPDPTEVDLPAARTKEIKLTGPKGGFGVLVLPEPGSGPVYGGRSLEESTKQGLLITAQPLALARIWALVPPVVPSPEVVLP
ncbi:hypothetical protein J5X84_03280 [Streptosporangiaceae bacterium NEAU-GS5]|nr:hypothetical protein [Streptosporangiaceae bacterium NEAU-GS5]